MDKVTKDFKYWLGLMKDLVTNNARLLFVPNRNSPHIVRYYKGIKYHYFYIEERDDIEVEEVPLYISKDVAWDNVMSFYHVMFLID